MDREAKQGTEERVTSPTADERGPAPRETTPEALAALWAVYGASERLMYLHEPVVHGVCAFGCGGGTDRWTTVHGPEPEDARVREEFRHTPQCRWPIFVETFLRARVGLGEEPDR